MWSSPLCTLLLAASLGWLSAFLMDDDHMTSSAASSPHFTACVSRDQATFRCWWSEGSFHNLSQPGALRVFYRYKKNSPWKECPEYIHSNKECFFDSNHTTIWTSCCVQLRSHDNVTYFNTEHCFSVENIVRPDPPVAVNWTLLGVSPYGLHYDVIVTWDPPASADVSMGWMSLAYEVQYRRWNSSEWTVVEVQGGTQQTLYGLNVEEEYEVHIRSRMKAFTKFGGYSDSIFIQLANYPVRESVFPVALVLGILAVVILLMLLLFSQQQRLTLLLLPPVPTPKIKGIDPEMLKKGKFEELNFILSGGGMGSSCTPLFYQDEPLVDCIELDPLDPADAGDKGGQSSEAQWLIGGRQASGRPTVGGLSHTLSFCDEDDDSVVGDPPGQDALWTLLTTPSPSPTSALLLPGQPELKQGFPGGRDPDASLAHDGAPRPQAWLNTDFYAQVSDVMPSGGVVLSPGQQLRAQESTAAREGQKEKEEEEAKKKKLGAQIEGEGKDPVEDEEPQQQFQLVVMAADPVGDGYTTDAMNWQTGVVNGYHTLPAESVGDVTAPSVAVKSAEDYQPSYILPDASPPPARYLPPVSDYTIVQEVDYQHSLILNPPPPQPPAHQCLPQHPLKPLTPMPVGYITPDLLGSITP
ncbi:unnamed protein product [Boreogadus saida]